MVNRSLTGYVTQTGNRLTSDGTLNYTHDDEGNLLTKTRISDGQVTEYTWDHRNRLTQVLVKTSGGTVLTEERFTYDVLNRRLGVWLDADGAGSGAAVQTWTLYNGANTYADFSGAGSLTTRYLFGPGLDFLLARVSAAGDEDWYLTDHLGSVRQIVNTNGTVQSAITYDTFGKILSETNPNNGDRFKYTGREYDAATDLYYYRSRYYAASTGRFLSEDTIGFAGGDANLFRYVSNSPTNYADPSGRWSSVGHHWVPVSVLNEVHGRLTTEAYQTGMGASSGPTHNPATGRGHGFDTHNGVTHGQYNDRVEKSLNNYLDDKAGKTGKLTGEQMADFAKETEKGNFYDPKKGFVPDPEGKIGKYNQGLKTTVLPKGGFNTAHETPTQLQRRGQDFIKNNRGRVIGLGIAGGIFGVFGPGVGDVAGAVIDLESNHHFWKGVGALVQGNEGQAQTELFGPGLGPDNAPEGGNSFVGDLVGKGYAGIGMAAAFSKMYKEAKERAEAALKEHGK